MPFFILLILLVIGSMGTLISGICGYLDGDDGAIKFFKVIGPITLIISFWMLLSYEAKGFNETQVVYRVYDIESRTLGIQVAIHIDQNSSEVITTQDKFGRLLSPDEKSISKIIKTAKCSYGIDWLDNSVSWKINKEYNPAWHYGNMGM